MTRNTRRWLRGAALGALAGVLACASEPQSIPIPSTTPADGAEGTVTGEGRDPDRWPRTYVAGPGPGAALLFPTPEGVARVGFISEGTPLQIAGFPENGHVPIRIMEGGMKVKALIDAQRFALRVQRRGKIGGTSVSVAPNDYVQFLGPAEEEGLLRVRVGARFGRDGVELPTFEGVYPADRLGAEAVTPDGSFEPGAPRALPAGLEVPLFESPDGEVITTLPALNPPMVVQLVQERGEWKAVRVGTGPFLVGWLNADLMAASALEEPPAPRPTAGPGEIPMRIRIDADSPLWKVRSGTWVRFAGQRVARLEADGWAREMGRSEDGVDVDVFVAVDDSLAIRGWVPADALVQPPGAAPPQPAAAQPAAPPANPTPSEGPTEPGAAPETEPSGGPATDT